MSFGAIESRILSLFGIKKSNDKPGQSIVGYLVHSILYTVFGKWI